MTAFDILVYIQYSFHMDASNTGPAKNFTPLNLPSPSKSSPLLLTLSGLTLVLGAVLVGLVTFLPRDSELPARAVAPTQAVMPTAPPTPTPEEEYANPFDEDTQYVNPFEETVNPFDELTE